MTALPQLDAQLGAIAVRPGDLGYRRVRSTYMHGGSPAVVLRVRNESDVSAAVRYARQARTASDQHVGFAVRSGGHGMSGGSTNDAGIVVDLSALNHIDVIDAGTGRVRIGAGAVWGDVAHELAAHDLVLTSGNFGDTGVGGLATAGGIGYFVRAHGLTLDRVVAARVVTADGHVHAVDAAREPDLFWAIRGGMTQVGIVTELELSASYLAGTRVIHQQVTQLVDDLPGFTESWGALLSTAPRELTSNLQLQRIGDGRHVISAHNVWAGDHVEAAAPVLQAFLALAQVSTQQTQVVPYHQVVPTPRWPHDGQQRIHMRNALVQRVDRATGVALAAALAHPASLVGELRSVGGAMNDVDPLATAWPHRRHEGLVSIWARPAPADVIDEAWLPLSELADGLYPGYTSDVRPARAAEAWPQETGERLRAIAEHADPDGLFDAGLTIRGVPQGVEAAQR